LQLIKKRLEKNANAYGDVTMRSTKRQLINVWY